MNNLVFYHKNALKIRKEKRLTLNDIERITGYSRSIVSEWERGKKTPKLDQVKLLADLYKTSLSGLCNINTSENLCSVNLLANDISNLFKSGDLSLLSNIAKLTNGVNLIVNTLAKVDIILKKAVEFSS